MPLVHLSVGAIDWVHLSIDAIGAPVPYVHLSPAVFLLLHVQECLFSAMHTGRMVGMCRLCKWWRACTRHTDNQAQAMVHPCACMLAHERHLSCTYA
eukprot:1153447-Pelagomonas_calceolata.AAC.9